LITAVRTVVVTENSGLFSCADSTWAMICKTTIWAEGWDYSSSFNANQSDGKLQ